MTNLTRLRDFVVATARIAESEPSAEAEPIAVVSPLLAELVSHDDWLPDEYATAHPQYYRQYLLHADPLGRFSIVSFVWGPGQRTPVHDHQVWGLVGILRGAEISTSYTRSPGGALIAAAPERLEAGTVAAVSPTIGDIHLIANAFDDRLSVSIHVYGGKIGTIRRSVFDPASGAAKPFVSGYSNLSVPNLWASAEAA